MPPPPTRPRTTRLEFSVVIPARKRVTTSTSREHVGEAERDGNDVGGAHGSHYESGHSHPELEGDVGVEEADGDGNEVASFGPGGTLGAWPLWRFPSRESVKEETDALLSLGPVEQPTFDFEASSSRELFVRIYAASKQRDFTVVRLSTNKCRQRLVLGCNEKSYEQHLPRPLRRPADERCGVKWVMREVNGRWRVVECKLEHNAACVKKRGIMRTGTSTPERVPDVSVDGEDWLSSDDEDVEPSTPPLTPARSSLRSLGLPPPTLGDKRPRSSSPSLDVDTKPELRPRSAFPSPISETKPGTRSRSASPSPETYVETKPEPQPEPESLEAEVVRLRAEKVRLKSANEELARELEGLKEERAIGRTSPSPRKKTRIGM